MVLCLYGAPCKTGGVLRWLSFKLLSHEAYGTRTPLAGTQNGQNYEHSSDPLADGF